MVEDIPAILELFVFSCYNQHHPLRGGRLQAEKEFCYMEKHTPKSWKMKWIIYTSIMGIILVLNGIAWNSTAFCDAYITYVFPIWVNTYGRLTGVFPFSVGEWLLLAGILLAAVAILLGIVCLVLGIFRRFAGAFRCFARSFYHFFAWVVLIVCAVMTLNCTILYHASTFSQKYFGQDTGDYALTDLIEVYNYVTEQCNRLSQEVTRDAEGRIVYASADGERLADYLAREGIASMQKLGKIYSQLDGYYSRPKTMFFSDFMCQQYMCGYYFPFSMEANYNDVMYLMNKPSTICHELAHLRGYIFEDEANFIAYLACLESDDVLFQYSGYLSVITYLENDLYRAMRQEPEALSQAMEEMIPIEILPQVREDNIFVEQREWDRIHEKALLDTETVDEISDTVTDTTLKLNGVSDGMISYSRVVRLLLQYYDAPLTPRYSLAK